MQCAKEREKKRNDKMRTKTRETQMEKREKHKQKRERYRKTKNIIREIEKQKYRKILESERKTPQRRRTKLGE